MRGNAIAGSTRAHIRAVHGASLPGIVPVDRIFLSGIVRTQPNGTLALPQPQSALRLLHSRLCPPRPSLTNLWSITPEDFYNRIYFLYQIIEDTQETVRFLDTKAGFCVTLLSGMAAVSIQHPGTKPALHIVLFALFMAVEVCSILVCLRVIFPTVKPHINNGAPAKPRFYIAHNKAHHWVKHTLANPSDNILSESKISYFESLKPSHR